MRVTAKELRDGITIGETYHVISEREKLYMIIDDYGRKRDYFKERFDSPILDTIHFNQKFTHTNGRTYEVKEVHGVVSLVEFVEPPIIGELCLFNTDKVNINQNYGQVGFLTRIEEGLFYIGLASYTFCKPIRCMS